MLGWSVIGVLFLTMTLDVEVTHQIGNKYEAGKDDANNKEGFVFWGIRHIREGYGHIHVGERNGHIHITSEVRVVV